MEKATAEFSYDLSRTKRIFETRRKLTANKKLNSGWVLIGVVLLEKGFVYSLALPERSLLPRDYRPNDERLIL